MTLMEQGRIEYSERAFDQDAAAAMKGCCRWAELS